MGLELRDTISPNYLTQRLWKRTRFLPRRSSPWRSHSSLPPTRILPSLCRSNNLSSYFCTEITFVSQYIETRYISDISVKLPIYWRYICGICLVTDISLWIHQYIQHICEYNIFMTPVLSLFISTYKLNSSYR